MLILLDSITNCSPLPKEQLDVMKRQYLNEEPCVSVQTKFNYAWGLVKSNNVDEQQLGVKLLTEVFKEAPKRRRETLYYLSIGSFKLGDYTNARKYCDILLELEPENMQAAALKQVIEDKVSKGKLFMDFFFDI